MPPSVVYQVATTYMSATVVDSGAAAGTVHPDRVNVVVAAEEPLIVVAFGVATTRCQSFQLDDIIAEYIAVAVVAARSAAGVIEPSQLDYSVAAHMGSRVVDAAGFKANGRR